MFELASTFGCTKIEYQGKQYVISDVTKKG